MEDKNVHNRSILDNDIQLQDSEQQKELDYEDENSRDSSTQAEYIYTYSGQAMNQQELFQLSAHEDLKLVLVAGPFSSGKTTLETMLYYIFLEGKNERLNFGGSYTIPGFRKRAEKIMYRSGEPEPVVDRTLRASMECFLHLRVYDESGQGQNLVFADFSGEVFENAAYIDDYCEIFEETENVIVIIDGEKVCDVNERKNIYTETNAMIRQFLQKKIITCNTKLHVVCTKWDKIQELDDKAHIEQFMEVKWRELLRLFENVVFSMNYIKVSALHIEEKGESEKLEEIMQNCLQSVPTKENKNCETDTLERIRQFEYFGIRGRRYE